MNRLKRFIEHVFSFSSAHLWVVGLLGLATFLQAFNIGLFDSFVSGLYVGTFGEHDLAFSFILGAVALILCGWISLKLDRRFGVGFISVLVGFSCVQCALFALYKYAHVFMAFDGLFLLKWGYRLIVFTGFWAFAFRYIELSLKSKRFLFLVLCEFLGFFVAGFFAYAGVNLLGADTLFIATIISTYLLIAVIWRISGFEKIMPELQLKKNGGVFEKTQLKLVYLIYTLAFCVAAITAFVDYSLCVQAFKVAGLNVEKSIRFFAVPWILLGASALFLMLFLYTIRRSLNITSAMIVLGLVPWVCVFGISSGLIWVVLFAKVLLELISYFCVGYYFRMLPRPLSHGFKSRLKGARLMVAQPFGFALTGLLFYYVAYQQSALLYACILSFVFLLALFDCHAEYAKVLLSAFKTFRWRGGRLMIQNAKVIEFIENKVDSTNPQEVIYFLRILEDAQVNNLKNHLMHALSHKDEQVRLFALECIERNNLRMFKKTLSDVMDKDVSVDVRQKALSVFCALGEKYAVEKAILYLDDPVLKKGALIGLLKTGGQEVLMASQGVNEWAMSKNPQHRKQAAEILYDTGLKGFFKVVQKLMLDENISVQKTAILAAGRLKHTGLIKLIFKALNKIELREEALQALRMFEAAAYPFIETALCDDERTDLCKKTLVSYLWTSEDIEAKKVLLRTLKNMEFPLRLYTLQFLKTTPLILSDRFIKKTFIPLIETDFKQALTTLLLIKDLRISPTYDAQGAFEQLCRSLSNDFYEIRQSLLLEIYFYAPSVLMKQAVHLLLLPTSTEQEKQMAQSTLDDLLPKSYHKLDLIIQDMPFEDRILKLPTRKLKLENSMTDQFAFILKSRSYRSQWTKVCALNCVRKVEDVALIEQIESLLTDKSPVIRENAIWALQRLIPDKKALKKVLSICLKDSEAQLRQMVSEILK